MDSYVTDLRARGIVVADTIPLDAIPIQHFFLNASSKLEDSVASGVFADMMVKSLLEVNAKGLIISEFDSGINFHPTTGDRLNFVNVKVYPWK